MKLAKSLVSYLNMGKRSFSIGKKQAAALNARHDRYFVLTDCIGQKITIRQWEELERVSFHPQEWEAIKILKDRAEKNWDVKDTKDWLRHVHSSYSTLKVNFYMLLEDLSIERQEKQKTRKAELVPAYIPTPKEEELFPKRFKVNMRYEDQLKHPQWRQKRAQILVRDRYACRTCGATKREGNYLHVHHKAYKPNRYAWEYPDIDLITLCERCHRAIHSIKVENT